MNTGRIVRLADGWFPSGRPGPELAERLEIVQGAAIAAGRDPSSIGIEGRLEFRSGETDRIAADVAAWREMGATHLSVNTMNLGLATAAEHVAALESVAAVLR